MQYYSIASQDIKKMNFWKFIWPVPWIPYSGENHGTWPDTNMCIIGVLCWLELTVCDCDDFFLPVTKVIRYASDPRCKVGVSLHGSFLDAKDAEAVRCPIFFAVAKDDSPIDPVYICTCIALQDEMRWYDMRIFIHLNLNGRWKRCWTKSHSVLSACTNCTLPNHMAGNMQHIGALSSLAYYIEAYLVVLHTFFSWKKSGVQEYHNTI